VGSSKVSYLASPRIQGPEYTVAKPHPPERSWCNHQWFDDQITLLICQPHYNNLHLSKLVFGCSPQGSILALAGHISSIAMEERKCCIYLTYAELVIHPWNIG
jgi:hypothetical protein